MEAEIILKVGATTPTGAVIEEIIGVIRESIVDGDGNPLPDEPRLLDVWEVVSRDDDSIFDGFHCLGSLKIPENHPFSFLKKGSGSIRGTYKTTRMTGEKQGHCYISCPERNENIIEVGAEIKVSLPTQKVQGKVEKVFCLYSPKRFVFIINDENEKGWWIETRMEKNGKCAIEIFPKEPSVTFLKLGIDRIY